MLCTCYAGPGGALGQPSRPCHEADWSQADGLRLSGGEPSCFTTLMFCQEPFCTGAWRKGDELQQGGGGGLPGNLRQRHGRDGRGLEGGRDHPPGEEADARRPQHHHPELLSHSPTKVVIWTHFQLDR